MAELAAAGALAFTDDGMPVASAQLMRRALAYSAVAGRPLALHCEEPTLDAGRPHARGRRLRRARAGRLAVHRGDADGRARPRARRLRGPAGTSPASLGTRLRRRGSACAARRRRGERRGKPSPPLRDRRARPLARPEREDEPAAADGGRPSGARRGAARRHDRLRGDRSRTACATGEGRSVRGGAVRGDGARDGVRRAAHAPRPRRRGSLGDGARADVQRAPREPSACPSRGLPSGSLRTWCSSTSNAEWTVREDGFRSRSANSWLLGERLVGAVVKTVADGRVVFDA